MAMRITNPLRALRNMRRVGEISLVMAKYGWGDMLTQIGLASALQEVKQFFSFQKPSKEISSLPQEVRIRLMLEELGPTFVKLGQVLATRPDLIPMSLTEELRKLQDNVPPFGAEKAREVLGLEYGRPVEEVFAHFETEPLAAASIAQVHRARLRDGPEVILKVRRPGIERTIQNDLDILETIAELVETQIPEFRRLNPLAIVHEFRKSITKEMDFNREAKNVKRFAMNFADDPTVYVPEVFDEYTTSRVLCEEFVDGVKMKSELMAGREGIDVATVANNGIAFVLNQVFVHGFFHADPHPGNTLVMDGNRICHVDYGMMGSLPQERIDDMLSFLVAILTKNVDKLIRVLERLELMHEDVNLPALRADVSELIETYYSVEIATLNVGRYLGELLEVINSHQIALPADLLLMGKSLATIEGVARDIHPELDPIQAIRPFILKIYVKRLADPGYFTREPLRLAEETMTLIQGLPRDLRTITRRLGRGELDMGLRLCFEIIPLHGLEDALRERVRSENRHALAIILSACILAGGFLLTQVPQINEVSVWGVTPIHLAAGATLGLAVLYGAVLLVGHLRSGGI